MVDSASLGNGYNKLHKSIYSRLSRCSTARGSCTGLVTVGPTKSDCQKLIVTLDKLEEDGILDLQVFTIPFKYQYLNHSGI